MNSTHENAEQENTDSEAAGSSSLQEDGAAAAPNQENSQYLRPWYANNTTFKYFKHFNILSITF